MVDDGRWIAPVLTPAEADALRERAERAEADFVRERDDHARTIAERDEAQRDAGCREYERDRYREAVGRLRDLAYEAANDPDVHYRVQEMARDVLSATTDEAIQGYDEPPEPDAVLVAKANAALVAEVAELRAELAAERGEEAGALPGWASDVEGLWTLGRIAEADRADLDGWRWYVGRDVKHHSGIVSRGVERTARAAMRAAEAEARRLGLLKDDP